MAADNRDHLFRYITGILKNKTCYLCRINGVEDHLHIVTHLHPSVALVDLVKDAKLASSDYIKREKLFSQSGGWQDGYGAFTHSIEAKKSIDRICKEPARAS